MSKKNKIILSISIIIAGVLSIFASSFPDGLEKVAEDKGFIVTEYALINGVIPDYAIPGIGYEPLAVALAGIIGALVVFVIVFVLGKIIIYVSYCTNTD